MVRELSPFAALAGGIRAWVYSRASPLKRQPMIATLVVLYGLALLVFRATRAPPGYTDYREGEILE